MRINAGLDDSAQVRPVVTKVEQIDEARSENAVCIRRVALSIAICHGLSPALLYDASDEDFLEGTPARRRIN